MIILYYYNISYILFSCEYFLYLHKNTQYLVIVQYYSKTINFQSAHKLDLMPYAQIEIL